MATIYCALDKEQCAQHCPSKRDPYACPYTHTQALQTVNISVPQSETIADVLTRSEKAEILNRAAQRHGFTNWESFSSILSLRLGENIFKSLNTIIHELL